MSKTDYNVLFYEKMKTEQDKYKDWLLTQPPSEILNHTYEYTMREDIVMCMKDLDLSPNKALSYVSAEGEPAIKAYEFLDEQYG